MDSKIEMGPFVRNLALNALVSVLALGMMAGQAPAAEPSPYTPAQLALFDTPHLQNIDAPITLRYDFRRREAGGGYDDRVDLIVTEVLDDGRKDLRFEFLSGDRQRHFPDVKGFRGNPLIMLFLQHDVEEMQRAAGGATGYYRNRIRFAFRDAQMEPTTVDFGEQTLAAKRITIRPYAQDPNRERFPRFADMWYEFVLAPAIPGGIYRIRSVVPAGDARAPEIENSVTYSDAGT